MSVQRLCPFSVPTPLVIKMECIQKQQSTICVEPSTSVRIKPYTVSGQTKAYDKAFAEFRRHLASEEAIRQLEQRKALSAAMAYRMSLMR